MAREAIAQGAQVVVSTYNEPLITSEWAVAVFKEAKAAGLSTGYVSNGNATPQVLEYLRPWLDLFKVDLKSFNPANYRGLGARLDPILESIRQIHRMGFWTEIVTLVVPDFNDSDGELRQIADFLVSISPDIPWHVTAFHKNYRMTDPDNTSTRTLQRAADIGRMAGLNYVYAGNIPGRVGDLENTRCPNCQELLIARYGYLIQEYKLTPDGRCPSCRTEIAGRWSPEFQGQKSSRPFLTEW
jgi:pyruvate formate lyase activating enzyme